MPKLAHNFVQGKMNKDLDERLVPAGQYRDALNIQVSTSEGSDVGAVENILGNTKLNKKSSSVNWAANFGLTSAQCIGTARDTQNNKLYWFVTSASVFEGLLCWTDNLNEPRKILISRFKAGSTQGGTSINTHTQVYSRPFIASDVTVIKKKPNERLSHTAASSTRTGNGVGLDRVTVDKTFVETVNGFRVTMDIGSERDFFTSAAPNWLVGDIITLRATEFNNDRNVDDNYEVRMKLTIAPAGTGANLGKFIENAIILSISSDMPDIELTWECELQEESPMFELSFPRFSYRWKYIDGEISAFGPWTNPIFVPGSFDYGSYDTFNEGMVNNLRKLTLSGFETPPADVDKIEILYKDSSENIVYRIDDHPATVSSIDITSEVAINVIESNQILRPYDNVPTKALAQEVIGNRLVYGNYVQNYDIAEEIDLAVSLQTTDITAVKTPQESVKSLRDYQVGVVYLDAHGRETPVFTNSSSVTGGAAVPSTIKVGIEKSSKVNKIRARVENDSPGSWATHFKYYIKEISNEYYNVALDRYYADPDGFMWLSIPSAERNKVQEGDFLILKKQHNTDLPVTSESKFKVLDISNEAPDAVAVKRKFKSLVGITRGASTTKITTGLTEFTFEGPTPNAGNDSFVDALKADVYVRFISGANKTRFYKVVTGGFSGETNAGYSLEISEQLQLTDASFINSLATDANFKLELHEEKRLTLPEYQGRFFVKINRNTTFDENVVYNYTNNPEDYEEKGNTNAHPSDTIFDDPDNTGVGQVLTELGWAEHANANLGSVVLTGKPTGNSKKFGVIQSPYVSGTTPGASIGGNGSKMADFVTGAEAGDFIQFGSAAGIWSNLYTLNSVIKGTYSRNASPTGNTDDETGYRWEFTLNEPYTDTDIAADRFRLAKKKRQQPTVFDENSDVLPSMNPAIFEVEPREAIDLELYYEASDVYPIGDIGDLHTLDYFNCYSFGNGVESDRVRDDFNAKRIGKGVKVSSILETAYVQERRKAGLIYSGLFNSTSGVNELNQFIQGLKITKDLNPIYGGIQILKARDTDLVTLCEDKCFRVQANKDALFTADGNPNVTSTNNVLGQTIAYAGEFGISNNPESFTTYGFRSYFTDKARGTVIRLSRDGITEIAESGMSDYFEDKLKATSGAILGSYDEAAGSYNVSFSSDESVAFKEGVRGWTSRMSFVPEAAISLNNDYYTIKNGELWLHNSATRSNFYGVQEYSTVTPIFNDAPSSIKNFKTLSYEGDAGWTADVLTDQQDGEVEAWKKKENLYFNYIKGKATTLSNIDTGEFSVQGLGDLNDDPVFGGSGYALELIGKVNVSLQVGDIIYSDAPALRVLGTVAAINKATNVISISTSGALSPAPEQYDFILFAKDSEKNTSGIIGYHASVEMKTTSSDKKELFAVNSEVFISSE